VTKRMNLKFSSTNVLNSDRLEPFHMGDARAQSTWAEKY
jgi:hypothetical protein